MLAVDIDLTHFFDSLFIAIPATVAGVAAVIAARNSRRTRKEVQSPNGKTTGDAVYALTQDLKVLQTIAEQVILNQATHNELDKAMFREAKAERKRIEAEAKAERDRVESEAKARHEELQHSLGL